MIKKLPLFSLLFVIAAITAGHRPGTEAEDLIKRMANRFSALQRISYHQTRTLDDPDNNYHNVFEGDVFLDFSHTDSLIHCRFQFNSPGYFITYNGTEDFMGNHTKHTLQLDEPGKELFNGYSFLNHSLYTLKEVLPQMANDADVMKSLCDTTIGGETLYNLTLTFTDRYFENLGNYVKPEAGTQTVYHIIVNKTTLMPVALTRTNNKNRFKVQMQYDSVDLSPSPVPDSSWYYSSCLPRYKLESKKETPLAQPGILIPAWRLTDARSGQTITAKNFKSKLLLMEFWIKNCGYCLNAMPRLERLQHQYKTSDLQVIGINIYDKPAEVSQLLNSSKVSYPNMINGHSLSTALGVSVFPSIVITDRQGKVVYAGLFDEAKIEAFINAHI